MSITLNGTSGVTTPGISNSEGYTGDGLSIAAGAPAGAVTVDASGNVSLASTAYFNGVKIISKTASGIVSGTGSITVSGVFVPGATAGTMMVQVVDTNSDYRNASVLCYARHYWNGGGNISTDMGVIGGPYYQPSGGPGGTISALTVSASGTGSLDVAVNFTSSVSTLYTVHIIYMGA